MGYPSERPNRQNYDFIEFYRKDLDWAAFVQILFTVNLGLIAIDTNITYHDYPPEKYETDFPLLKVQ